MPKPPTRSQASDSPSSSAQTERRRTPRGRVRTDQSDSIVAITPGAPPLPAESIQPVSTHDEHDDDIPATAIESVSMGSEPSEEDIRLRAYQRYLERGRRDGADFDDWLTAEAELRKR